MGVVEKASSTKSDRALGPGPASNLGASLYYSLVGQRRILKLIDTVVWFKYCFYECSDPLYGFITYLLGPRRASYAKLCSPSGLGFPVEDHLFLAFDAPHRAALRTLAKFRRTSSGLHRPHLHSQPLLGVSVARSRCKSSTKACR